MPPFGQRSGPRGKRGDKKPGDKEKGQRRPMFRRRKVCKFCADKIDDINYKDVKLLSPFVPERGKICLLYTSPSPRDRTRSRMPSSA